MTADDELLRAILDAPDDDGPRLAFADYLDEHGQPERAAFIRVQIDLARLPAGDGRRGALKARERALLARHGVAWAGPLRTMCHKWEFRGGFVEVAEFEADDYPGSPRAASPAHHLPYAEFAAVRFLTVLRQVCRLTPIREVVLKQYPHLRPVSVVFGEVSARAFIDAVDLARMSVLNMRNVVIDAAVRDPLRAHFGHRLIL